VDIWNEVFTGRGAVRLRHSSPLDNYILAKPYFDPNGLIVAQENQICVGFVHAGFGPNPAQTALSPEAGVACRARVRPAYRPRGDGTRLLHRAEEYLKRAGAGTLYAGRLKPMIPFSRGLYGGSELPGFLASDATAEPFLLHHGYQVHDSVLVLQRQLIKPVNV